MMNEMGFCKGIENYSRHLSGRQAGEPPPTLIDYLPARRADRNVDESHVTIPQVGGMYNGDRSRKTVLVEYGFRLPRRSTTVPSSSRSSSARMRQAIFFVSATPAEYERTHASQVCLEQVVRPTGLIDPVIIQRPASSQVDDLALRGQQARPEERAGPRHDAHQAHGRGPQRLPGRARGEGALPSPLGHRHRRERVEIIRDLRKGIFDVLVGINLLREGLDMPEVSLVAILDADKEGFLRSWGVYSSRSIGRAARHINGTAILYADQHDGFHENRAMDETDRRRAKQVAFNLENGIEPAPSPSASA